MTEAGTGGGSLFDMLGEQGKQYLAGPDATDGAKKAAEELRIDLRSVTGTGKDGRIKESDVREVVKKKEREEAAKKARQANGTEEPDEYPENIHIRYAGHTITVPDRKMRRKEMLELAAETFPELAVGEPTMVYSPEKAMMVPVVGGHRKGAADPTYRITSTRAPEQPIPVYRSVPQDGAMRPVFWLLGHDGVYEVRRTQAGQFCAKVQPRHGVDVYQDFQLAVPKIPMYVMVRVIRLMRQDPKNEVMLNVLYDRSNDRYRIHIPDQKGSPGSVHADPLAETDDVFIVLQVHSHPGGLGAFFSATDDADERRTGLYGVVGFVTEIPECRFRYSVAGTFVEVDPESIFEDWDPWVLDPVEGS